MSSETPAGEPRADLLAFLRGYACGLGDDSQFDRMPWRNVRLLRHWVAGCNAGSFRVLTNRPLLPVCQCGDPDCV